MQRRARSSPGGSLAWCVNRSSCNSPATRTNPRVPRAPPRGGAACGDLWHGDFATQGAEWAGACRPPWTSLCAASDTEALRNPFLRLLRRRRWRQAGGWTALCIWQLREAIRRPFVRCWWRGAELNQAERQRGNGFYSAVRSSLGRQPQGGRLGREAGERRTHRLPSDA
jgi:hypothetical protein